MSLTRYEMETHILFNAEEKSAVVDTADPVYIRKLKKLCEEAPEFYSVEKAIRIDEEHYRVIFNISDKGRVKFAGKKREMSQERLEAMRNGLQNQK